MAALVQMQLPNLKNMSEWGDRCRSEWGDRCRSERGKLYHSLSYLKNCFQFFSIFFTNLIELDILYVASSFYSTNVDVTLNYVNMKSDQFSNIVKS